VQGLFFVVVIVAAVAAGAYFATTVGPPTETSLPTPQSTVTSAQASDVVLADILDAKGNPVSDAEIRLLEYRNGELKEAFSGLMPAPEFFRFEYAPIIQPDPRGQSYVHFSLEVTRPSTREIAVYDWSGFYLGGILQSTERIKLNLTEITTGASSGFGASSAEQPTDRCAPKRQILETWTNIATIVGEVHTTRTVFVQFSYGTGSAVSVDVAVNLGGIWKISGGVTKSTSEEWTWPTITDSSSSAHAMSRFNYIHEHIETASCFDYEKIYASEILGGTEWGTHVIGDDFDPQSVTAVPVAPGSSFSKTVESGRKFESAVEFKIYGTTVSLGASSAYKTYTSIRVSIGTCYAQYYFFTPDNGKTYFWSHSTSVTNPANC
jgi:hypothetical protein